MIGVFVVHVPFVVIMCVVIKPGVTSSIIMAICGVLVFSCIVLRRHYPILFFILVSLLLVLQAILLHYPTISLIVLLIAVYDVARWIRPRIALICLVVSILVIFVGPLHFAVGNSAFSGRAGAIAGAIIVLAAVSGIGGVTTAYSLARRGQEVSQARARQVRAERDAAQLQIAEQTARQHSLETQIRTNIARELHDIVAHSVAVMVVQAEGGLAQSSQSPQTAQQALINISDTGREALQEMRRIVRMLRADSDQTIDLASAPGIADIPALIEKANATQAVRGAPHGLTPIIEMTIYRVIQEALTNSMKHGGPDANPHVTVDWQPTQVVVKIVNNVSRTAAVESSDNTGVGLIGMAERVQTLDGTLHTGFNGKGGFEVCAQIPLRTDPLET